LQPQHVPLAPFFTVRNFFNEFPPALLFDSLERARQRASLASSLEGGFHVGVGFFPTSTIVETSAGHLPRERSRSLISQRVQDEALTHAGHK
jgi:hypothetical protein